MLKQGFTLMEAIQLLTDQFPQFSKQKLTTKVIELVKVTGQLHEVLKVLNYPQVIVTQIYFGENYGNLIETIDHSILYLKKIEHVKERFIKTIQYPALLLCIFFMLLAAVNETIIPQFSEIYESMNVEISTSLKVITTIFSYLPTTIFTIFLSLILIILLLYMNYMGKDVSKRIVFFKRIPFINKYISMYHSYKGIFRGKALGVDYKDKKPTGYVGTEKSTLFDITAVLKGKDIYKFYKQVKSKNYDIYGHMKAPTVFDDNVESLEELTELLNEQLVDEPVVEVSTNYLGYEQIQENHKVHLKHKPLQYDTDLKVVKLTESHPIMNVPVEIEFSNSRKDIVQIQQLINRNVRNVKNALKYGSGTASNIGSGTSWVSTGVVTVDD